MLPVCCTMTGRQTLESIILVRHTVRGRRQPPSIDEDGIQRRCIFGTDIAQLSTIATQKAPETSPRPKRVGLREIQRQQKCVSAKLSKSHKSLASQIVLPCQRHCDHGHRSLRTTEAFIVIGEGGSRQRATSSGGQSGPRARGGCVVAPDRGTPGLAACDKPGDSAVSSCGI